MVHRIIGEIRIQTINHSSCCFFFLSGVAASSLFTSGKYAIDPELRGLEYERITQNLDVHFWKTFWNITESEVLAVSINFYYISPPCTGQPVVLSLKCFKSEPFPHAMVGSVYNLLVVPH